MSAGCCRAQWVDWWSIHTHISSTCIGLWSSCCNTTFCLLLTQDVSVYCHLDRHVCKGCNRKGAAIPQSQASIFITMHTDWEGKQMVLKMRQLRKKTKENLTFTPAGSNRDEMVGAKTTGQGAHVKIRHSCMVPATRWIEWYITTWQNDACSLTEH